MGLTTIYVNSAKRNKRNKTLHDQFENLIDDLREKVMRNLKNTKHKYHVNDEIAQCLKWMGGEPHYTEQGCDYIRPCLRQYLNHPGLNLLYQFYVGDKRRCVLARTTHILLHHTHDYITPVVRCGIELLDHPEMRVCDLKQALKMNGQKGYSKLKKNELKHKLMKMK